MRIADFGPRIAYPLKIGSVVRTHNLLRFLSRNHTIRQFAQTRWSRHASVIEQICFGASYCAYNYSNPAACAIVEMSERSWVAAPVSSGAGLFVCRPPIVRELMTWAEVALIEFPWQFEYCRRLPSNARMVYASHNLESAKFRSYAEIAGVALRNSVWLRWIDRMERRAVEAAELVTAVSPEDREAFIAYHGADPCRVVVVPNGADTEKYRPSDPESRADSKRMLGLPAKPAALFVANRTPPNEVALRWVADLAKQAPQFTFLAIGPVVPKPYVDGNLIATGGVHDYRPYQQAADFAICPVEHGGGTKIKLLESLSAGLPTVCFTETILGTSFRPGEHLLVAKKSTGSLLEALENLHADSDSARRMGESARRHVVAHYDWAHIAELLEAALLRLVGSDTRAAGVRA